MLYFLKPSEDSGSLSKLFTSKAHW